MINCNTCKIDKKMSEFPKHPTAPGGISKICKMCKVESVQRSKFGMTTAEALRISSKCQICGVGLPSSNLKKKMIAIDHDHSTGLVRGILCTGCNTAIGKLGDSVEGLMRAVHYLQNPPLIKSEPV